MWANAQHDGHPAEYRWLPLFNAAYMWKLCSSSILPSLKLRSYGGIEMSVSVFFVVIIVDLFSCRRYESEADCWQDGDRCRLIEWRRYCRVMHVESVSVEWSRKQWLVIWCLFYSVVVFFCLQCFDTWLGGRKGIRSIKIWDYGGWWRWALVSPDGVSPSPKSWSSLLAPAQPGGPRKGAVKRLCVCVNDVYFYCVRLSKVRCLQCFDAVGWAARRASGL